MRTNRLVPKLFENTGPSKTTPPVTTPVIALVKRDARRISSRTMRFTVANRLQRRHVKFRHGRCGGGRRPGSRLHRARAFFGEEAAARKNCSSSHLSPPRPDAKVRL